MLIKCPECNKDVSNTAPSCPHCGYLFKTAVSEKSSKGAEEKRLRHSGKGIYVDILRQERLAEDKGKLRRILERLIQIKKGH